MTWHIRCMLRPNIKQAMVGDRAATTLDGTGKLQLLLVFLTSHPPWLSLLKFVFLIWCKISEALELKSFEFLFWSREPVGQSVFWEESRLVFIVQALLNYVCWFCEAGRIGVQLIHLDAEFWAIFILVQALPLVFVFQKLLKKNLLGFCCLHIFYSGKYQTYTLILSLCIWKQNWNRVDCWHSGKRSETHKRYSRMLFNQTKTRQNADFQGNPLLEATNITKSNK